MKTPNELATDFLKIADQFKLGELSTEKPHPKTKGLSEMSLLNLSQAIETLKDVDRDMLRVLKSRWQNLIPLKRAFEDTLNEGGKIFLAGCGATGRLSLSLETLWREKHRDSERWGDRLIGFMAGGDVALISSIEKFEDFPAYAHRQMKDLGFSKGDLLIGVTEGGETPFVIGATEEAARLSSRKPFFVYCNPDEILSEHVERSRAILENDDVNKINLDTGPQALAGSTRMQASSILMYAIGTALWCIGMDDDQILTRIQELIKLHEQVDFSFLKKLIEAEASIYQKNEYVLYQADESLGICVLTDTTERSPTFSLIPFESVNDKNAATSLSYLFFPGIENAQDAWLALLNRKPRTLEWEGLEGIACQKRLLGFDFSRGIWEHRKAKSKGEHHIFRVFQKQDKLLFDFSGHRHFLDTADHDSLDIHLLLKMILNIHSTLVMGRLGRYESNIMTWVRASNNKLIDRTVRYASALLKEKGVNVAYDDLVLRCFELKEKIPRDQPLVLGIVDSFSKNQG